MQTTPNVIAEASTKFRFCLLLMLSFLSLSFSFDKFENRPILAYTTPHAGHW
jgi:hypothetical protein